MLDHGRGGQTGVSAAKMLRDVGVEERQAANVRLVDDRVVPRDAGRPVVTPREGGVNHPALRRACCAVAPVERQIFLRATDSVAEVRVAPVQRALQVLRVRLDQQLVGVEAVSAGRFIRSVDPVAVQGPRTRLRQVAVPDLVRVLAQLDALQLVLAGLIEDAQLDFSRVGREQREVDAFAIPCRASGVGLAGPDRGDRSVVHVCLLVHPVQPAAAAMRLRIGIEAHSGRLPIS